MTKRETEAKMLMLLSTFINRLNHRNYPLDIFLRLLVKIFYRDLLSINITKFIVFDVFPKKFNWKIGSHIIFLSEAT